jgi:hypothetical protein
MEIFVPPVIYFFTPRGAATRKSQPVNENPKVEVVYYRVKVIVVLKMMQRVKNN